MMIRNKTGPRMISGPFTARTRPTLARRFSSTSPGKFVTIRLGAAAGPSLSFILTAADGGAGRAHQEAASP
jgi:hypothetical protein